MDRKKINIIILVDNSNQLDQSEIHNSNKILFELISKLKSNDYFNKNNLLDISLIPFNDYKEINISHSQSFTNLKSLKSQYKNKKSFCTALAHLSYKFSEEYDSYEGVPDDYTKPIIILLSNGKNFDDFKLNLKVMDQYCELFKRSMRFSISIGDDYEEQTLKSFSINKNAIFKKNEIDEFINLIIDLTETFIDINSKFPFAKNIL